MKPMIMRVCCALIWTDPYRPDDNLAGSMYSMLLLPAIRGQVSIYR